MATRIKSKSGLKGAYNRCSKEVRQYFKHLPALLEDYPMDVCLAYVFARLELAQNMALYRGAVKIHKVNAKIAKGVISTHHLTRKSFIELYKTVFDLDLPREAHADLKSAEATRDHVMHGKQTSDDRIRNAIARVLEYAEEINEQLSLKHNLKPFGDLRGFSGRARKLDIRTSRFLLKGMGFAIA